MYSPNLLNLARDFLDLCRAQDLTVVTVESCTGGSVAGCLTEIPGSSDVLDRGYVTYSNQAKQEEVGVPADTLEEFGAVSAETARAMALGALARTGNGVAVAITGIAGPGGGTAEKPVGLVFTATACGDHVAVEQHMFPGDRAAVREATVVAVLEKAAAFVSKSTDAA